MTRGRDLILDRLEQDLVGPFEETEILESRPSDVYLTGILWPGNTPLGADEDVRLGLSATSGEQAGEDGAEEEEVAARAMNRPSTAGLSFAAMHEAAGDLRLDITVSFATYEPVEQTTREHSDDGTQNGRKTLGIQWRRTPHLLQLTGLKHDLSGDRRIDLAEHGAPIGVSLHVRSIPWSEAWLMTISLVNGIVPAMDGGRRELECSTLFQVQLSVRPGNGTRLIARPSRRVAIDEDDMIAALLYSGAAEYAAGHTCSAAWDEGIEPGTASRVYTTWVPKALVPAVSPAGHELLAALRDLPDCKPLSAEWLTRADDRALGAALAELPAAYGHWIHLQEARIPDLPQEFRKQAQKNLDVCRHVMERMADGAARIATSPDMARAFRLATKAMLLQYSWDPERARHGTLEWRPFQLGFVLLAVASVADDRHPDREIMDLLWFPTGGGKTEAYLALIAFLAFHRRLRHPGDPDAGAGVAAVMRYTLRLLTTQQFARAAAMILACEAIRRGRVIDAGNEGLGEAPFSIGLWVGGDATPNSYEDAAGSLAGRADLPSPKQLADCPACRTPLSWEADEPGRAIHARCVNSACLLYDPVSPLPVHTVDEDLYREKPTLLIGTVDKFAQIVRRKEINDLFAVGRSNTPDLVIQDELHLISGPLGTLAGIYEVALDRMLTRDGRPPKVIGSTATIRRAQEQIRSLFNRSTCQFPPPALEAGDSGFAVTDLSAPGRLYAGITTAGRSAKFALQAVAGSLLQSACGAFADDRSRDPYWTLVSYFNSLRELGGALVLMQDDVNDTIGLVAKRRGEARREPKAVEELTSRRTQKEVRDMLDSLAIPAGRDGTLDVVLATNMLSVGVDIPRLGMMLVNGQPKGIAEYIQATSRVGRGRVPGLVVSVLNNAKARDRSHYENFTTWHSTLYRDVEVTSVTPFAPRARDRALHAVLVSLVRHIVPGMLDRPALDPAAMAAAAAVIDYITDRASAIDPGERSIRQELEDLLQTWEWRAPASYWVGRRPGRSLLQDAERAAALRAMGRLPGDAWPTMNNMRSVEPGTRFRLAGRLRDRNQGQENNG